MPFGWLVVTFVTFVIVVTCCCCATIVLCGKCEWNTASAARDVFVRDGIVLLDADNLHCAIRPNYTFKAHSAQQ